VITLWAYRFSCQQAVFLCVLGAFAVQMPLVGLTGIYRMVYRFGFAFSPLILCIPVKKGSSSGAFFRVTAGIAAIPSTTDRCRTVRS
jgi:hypothetical protein